MTVATHKPRREATEENRAANSLILDFWPPELRDSPFLLFKPPRLWHFVWWPKQTNTELPAHAEKEVTKN